MTAAESKETRLKQANSLLELILRKYSHASRDSIRGPVATKSDFQNFSRKSAGKSVAVKSESATRDVCSASHDVDNSGKLRETSLDGHLVGCFNVGGEKRVCFTELVRVVLKDIVNVHEIFTRRDELLIYCAQCTPQQLECLKLAGILPWTSSSSNLITKSDAYRLCGVLYGTRAPKADPSRHQNSSNSFEVFHECFGGCVGFFEPDEYSEPTSACIRCSECRRLFSTKKFVSHNHTAFDEVHTCHWGFDSSRWRSYLMLVEQNPPKELVRAWEAIKQKFDGHRSKKTACNSPEDASQDSDFLAYVKSPERLKTTISPIESLRSGRCINSNESNASSVACTTTSGHAHQTADRQSAFHPWSPTPSSISGGGVRQNGEASRFPFPAVVTASSDIPSVSASTSGPTSGLLLSPASGHNNNNCSNSARAAAFQPHSLGVVHAQFSHGPLSAASPLYLSCKQCKTAASSSCTGLQLLAQKASERPATHCHEAISEGKPNEVCTSGCDYCHPSPVGSPDHVEATIEDVFRRYMSSDHRPPNIRELSHILSVELKRLSLSQEDKLRELSIGTQRLQTELHLVKLEYQRKLNDALDAKRRVEQELEVVQREHQKDIARFNRITWEYHREVGSQSGKSDIAHSDATNTIEALREEIAALKSEIKQTCADKNTFLPKFRPWLSDTKKSPSKSENAERSANSETKPIIGFVGKQDPITSHAVHSWAGQSYPFAIVARETGSKSISDRHVNGSLRKKVKHSSSDTELRGHVNNDDSEDTDVEIED